MLFRIFSTQKTQCMGAIRFGHSVARSHSREMVVEFVNLSSNNREMDWRFLLNHKQNKGKLYFIVIIFQFFYLPIVKIITNQSR